MWGLLFAVATAACLVPSGAQKTVCTKEALADIVFLVDGSSSIGQENFQQIRQFLLTMVNSFNVGLDRVRIGLIQYSTLPHTEFFLNTFQDKNEILRNISSMPYQSGSTKTGLGLKYMLEHHFVAQAGSRADAGVPQLAVVVTDGKSQDEVKQVADVVKAKGITLYAIGIQDADLEELREIASDPEEKHVYSVSNFAALQGISHDIAQILCTTVEEATGPLTQVPQECRKATAADITFLVGASSSIGEENFQEIKKFLHSFVEALDISPNNVRVRVALSTNELHLAIPLGQYTDKRTLQERLDSLTYRSGSAFVGKALQALQALQNSSFSQVGNGRGPVRSAKRQTVPQVVVVIMDERSRDQVWEQAEELRRKDNLVFAIGVGVGDADQQLQQIANSPHDRFLLKIDSYRALQEQTNSFLQMVCAAVENKIEALATQFADVLILVDSSLPPQLIKSALIRLVTQLDVGLDANQIGLVVFGRDTKVEFRLDEHGNKEQTLNYLRNNFRFRRIPANEVSLGQAVSFAQQNLLTTAAGSRVAQGFPQYLVVFTSGQSQDSIRWPVQDIKNQGVTVISVGVSNADTQKLEIIGTAPHIFQLDSPSSMNQVIQKVKGAIESKRILGFNADCITARLVDLVFIVDESGSIDSHNFKLIRDFIYQIVDGLDVNVNNVRVGIVLYSDTPRSMVYLNTFEKKSDLLQFISILPYRGGGTKTGAALKFAREKIFSKTNGGRRDQRVQQVAVVITDGQSQDNVTDAAASLRRTGVTVYAVGVKDANRDELNTIASHPPRKYVFQVDNFGLLKKLEGEMRKFLCHGVVQTTFSAPAVRFNVKEACVQTEEADIYFLLDESGSISPSDFLEMKKFVREFVRMFKIGPDQVRIGLVKYASSPKMEFSIEQHRDKRSLERAVDKVIQDGGGTETGKALSFMDPWFQKAAESRDVPRVLIVITDGSSTDEVELPANMLKKQGITIYAIGVMEADQKQLKQIATKGKTFFVNNFDALTNIKLDVVSDICSKEVCKDMEADILFLVDSSGSISPSDYSKMKTYLASMVDKSAIGRGKVHLGVLQFSGSQQEVFPLDKFYEKAAMKQAINGMKQLGGGTLTGEALKTSSRHFDTNRPGINQFLIVITDGEAQDEVAGPAKELRNKGVFIYSIGVLNANSSQLLEISGSQDKVYVERDFDALQFIEQEILFKLCHPEPATDCTRTEMADMIFLVDGSSSIQPDQFQSMLRFMMSMVNHTEVALNRVRVGVIIYSNTPQVIFTLNQYQTKTDVRKAISDLDQPGGDTYTSASLVYSKAYFSAANGGRETNSVPKILMVITDGEASDGYDLLTSSKEVRNSGIDVYGIGVAGANETELEMMTADRKKVFYVGDYKALETLYKNISKVLCNETKPACEVTKTDIVILVDGSESISEHNFLIMKNFILALVNSFTVEPTNVRIGMAQFSSKWKNEFYLNQYKNGEEVKKHITNMVQINGGTETGQALQFIRGYFQPSNGSRINQGVPQNLIVITDGKSEDDVQEAANRLRDMKIEIIAIGVGNASLSDLQLIAGTHDRIFTVENFVDLEKIKKRVFEVLCIDSKDKPDCTVDIGFGFDISRTGQQSLFKGQPNLLAYLPEIVRSMSVLNGLCCLLESSSVTPNIGFRVTAEDGKVIDDFRFEAYSEDVVKKVLALQYTEATYLNTQMLRSFSEKFRAQSRAGVKVLIIFTDGINELVENLEAESDRLRSQEINALLLVALEGVKNTNELQMIEYGRGFGYKQPLTIGMPNVASVMLKQLDTVVGRECCGVFCKCSGPEGVRGPRGPAGIKGLPGLRGHSGFPGDEGGVGERGLLGLNGTQGFQGCPGLRGFKGRRGPTGDRGEDGELGLDGITGEQGTTGLKGDLGPKGNPGNPGGKGPRGESGERGIPGLRGDPGEPGWDNRVLGPKGERGNPGIPGEPGPDGPTGEAGVPGNRGTLGRRGQPGTEGERGDPGTSGPLGFPGPNGLQGDTGPRGAPGPVGAPGLPGPQGRSGAPGNQGPIGSQGRRGLKGQPGDVGEKGVTGPLGTRGMAGLDGGDGYGQPGPKGQKGDSGFPGYPGLQGEVGQSGSAGGPGRKGNRGRGGNSGRPGSPGDPGTPGLNGHPGRRGIPGIREMNPCQLVNYVQDNCACSKGQTKCPVYPTELVIALDMSQDVTPQAFERMRTLALNLLEDVSIAESNCPTGARVAVVSYNVNTKYLVRFSDYHYKKQLIEAINNIPLESTANPSNMGSAMRFVARNVFKRVRQGLLMRKVAFFITSGPSEDQTPISLASTALLELRSLQIIPAVIAFRDIPNIRRAFEADEMASFLLSIRPESPQLQRVKQCAICHDPCRPTEQCRGVEALPLPLELDMDLAMVMDSSRNMPEEQYEDTRQLLGSVLDLFSVSSQPGAARVALVQHGVSGYRPGVGETPVRVEFDLKRYQDRNQMKRHIVQDMQQMGGASCVAHGVEWTIRNIMLRAGVPRKAQVVLAVIGGETSHWDRAMLESVALRAKCHGLVLLALTVGHKLNNTQVEELASHPLEQHIVHLGHVKEDEREYAQRFLAVFLRLLDKKMNSYPPPTLQTQCERVEKLTVQMEALDGRPIERIPVPAVPFVVEEEEEEESDVEEEYTGETATEEPLDVTQTQTLEELEEEEEEEEGDGVQRGDTSLRDFESVSAHCHLDLDHGTLCGFFVQKWYFNKAVSACLAFWYGGCHGNGNRFNTEKECLQTCRFQIAAVPQSREDVELPRQDVCSLQQDAGSCANYTLQWHFDKKQNKCSQFWYGGCGGNGNNFRTEADCESVCLRAA